MDEDSVALAVHEVGRFLRADGAQLTVVDTDIKASRIRLLLELDNVSCHDCVLDPSSLRATVRHALEARLDGEFELVIEDPRDLPHS